MNKENAIIGICINNNKLFRKLYKKKDIICNEKNIIIINQMCKLYENRKAFDLITLTELLRSKIDVLYLNELLDYSINESYFESYLKDLIEKKRTIECPCCNLLSQS